MIVYSIYVWIYYSKYWLVLANMLFDIVHCAVSVRDCD